MLAMEYIIGIAYSILYSKQSVKTMNDSRDAWRSRFTDGLTFREKHKALQHSDRKAKKVML